MYQAQDPLLSGLPKGPPHASPPLGALDTEMITASNLNDALSNHHEAAGPQTHFWLIGWAWRKDLQVRFGEKLFIFPTVCSGNAVCEAPWPRPLSLCWAQRASRSKELGIGTALQSGTCKFPLQSVARGGICFSAFLSAQGWASSLWCKGGACRLPEWRWITEGRDVLPGRRAQATPSDPCRENPERPFQVCTLQFLPVGRPALLWVCSLHCFDPLPQPPPSSGPFISCQV